MIDLLPIFARAYAHALETPERETCGLVVVPYGHLIYIPCRNIASAASEFEIHPEDYINAKPKGIVGVVHSHLHGSPEPSMADLVNCERSGLPWLIVALPNGAYKQITPVSFKAPLIGRPFVHGVLDCYSLARDYFAQKGIDVLDFEREADWWEKGESLLTPENFAKAGFRIVDANDLQADDVLVMQNGLTAVPNHVGVYLGDGMMLHHSGNALSCRTPYGGYWLKATNFVVRYDPK